MHQHSKLMDITNTLCRTIVVGMGLFVFAVTTVRAESFPLSDVVPQEVPVDQRGIFQAHAQKLADGMYNHLLLRLDEVDRVCELSESQAVRLTIAVKGAVQECLDEWLVVIVATHAAVDHLDHPQGNVFPHGVERRVFIAGGNIHFLMDGIVQMQRVEQVNVRGLDRQAVELKAEAGDVQIKALAGEVRLIRALPERNAIVQGVVQRRDEVAVPGLEAPLLNVAENPLWVGTLRGALSDPQRRLYAAAQAERNTLPREWRHERVLVVIDGHLLLDSAQRDALTVRVSKFLEMPQIKRWLERRPGFEDEALAQMALRAIPVAEVKDILSEQQLYQWQQLLKDDEPAQIQRGLDLQ